MMKNAGLGLSIAGIVAAIGTMTAVTQRQTKVGLTALDDPGRARYSTLSEITPKNVGNLKPVWVYDTGVKGRGWEVTPVIEEGVMYLSIPGAAAAVDPETGKELWRFTPSNLARPGRERGVAFWPGNGTLGARVLYTTTDRLYELDAKTGLPVTDFGTNGMITLRDGVADKYPNAQYSINSPAGVYKNLAIISPSTQEFGSKGPSGDPRAFDILTGKQVWRFHTVPQPGEAKDGSWGPEGWKDRAGPSAWSGSTVDAATGLVFIAIGNPDDSYNGIDRPGNNYYANSVVALDAASGTLKWFYQFTHHDITDFDAAAAPTLIDVHRNGQVIPALVEVPKSGIAFILDRRTGDPVFGVEERSVPKSDVPGEQSSPTQPFPLMPPPLAKMTISKTDLTTMTPEAHDFCVAAWDRLKLHNEGPYTTASANDMTVFMPGTSGGANWGGVSTDPRLGYFFVNVSNMPTTSRMAPDGAGGFRLQGAYMKYGDDKGWPCINPPWGELIAVNANTGAIAWRSPLGSVDDYGDRGKTAGTVNIGGSFASAGGLVFIGATIDSKFRAFDSHTGKEVWTASVPGPAVANPVIFRSRTGREMVVTSASGPGTLAVPGRGASYKQILIAYALPKPGETPVDLAQYAPTVMQGGRGFGGPAGAGGPGGGPGAGGPGAGGPGAGGPGAGGRAAGGQGAGGQAFGGAGQRPAAAPAQAPVTAAAGAANGEIVLPDGPNKDDVVSMCSQCHGISTAVGVRRSSEGWHDLIQDMRARGAQGDNAKAARVQDYLTRYFGLMSDPAVAPR